MDGTLVDSEKLWDVALQELAATYGGTLSAAARRAIVGTSMAASMRIVHDDLGQPERDPQASAAWINERILELFRTGLAWRPGASALLRAVRAAGIPTALVTSSGRPLVEVALDTLGRDSFDAVVCGDEVDAAKPHPEPYLTAARLLGVPIGRCVAIEDSPTGVASALAAGAAVLAVPLEVPIPAADGVHQLESLTAADLELLAALLGEPPA
ncbi:haloacid dehalogenase superfamily, subfamily IA, variant 3 with third motif having DD or ED [Micromonospora mirobrigensis]|uniref:Haloacid dehalogenase superfamily, subfamily IA, variant 3 with third motif having DD or ED n=2 Tax=Micromonospora mirobrigensis TaxID=262898 RepID=A0A1C4YNH3_9ACTN|nr:haloacid dehalogenase superfamily, subfamily IA, variant 3 with third motif having DD or ED [Micromonospora mirobrigensis]